MKWATTFGDCNAASPCKASGVNTYHASKRDLPATPVFQHDKKDAARPFEVLRGSFNEQEYTGEVEIWWDMKCSTSSTAQGGGGSFQKIGKPIGEVGFVVNHGWQSAATDGPTGGWGLPLFSLSFLLLLWLSTYLPIYVSIYLSCLSFYLSIHPSIHPSIYLPIYLSTYLSIYLSVCLSIYPSIHPSLLSCLSPTSPQVKTLKVWSFKTERQKRMLAPRSPLN